MSLTEEYTRENDPKYIAQLEWELTGKDRRQRPRGLPVLPVRVEGTALGGTGGAMAADNPENELQQVWQTDCTGDCEA